MPRITLPLDTGLSSSDKITSNPALTVQPASATYQVNDGDWLVDDLFYYSQNHDGVDGARRRRRTLPHLRLARGRDPDAFFSTQIYLSANSDVKAANVGHR